MAQLSVLELILLTALQRLVASGKGDVLNFEMVGTTEGGREGGRGWLLCL